MRNKRTYERDIERLTENIYNNYPFIENKEQFDAAWADYLEGEDVMRDLAFKEEVWDRLGRKSLKIQKYKLKEKDLAGKKKPKPLKERMIKLKKKVDYKYAGKQKGKIVRARQVIVTYKKLKRSYIKYRGMKGRWVSVKRK